MAKMDFIDGSVVSCHDITNDDSGVTYTVALPNELGPMSVSEVYLNNSTDGVGDRLARIEKLLNIIPRRRDLEAEFDDFCRIGEKYETDIENLSKEYARMASEFELLQKLNQNNS